MKKNLLLLFSLSCILLFSECKKYKEDPITMIFVSLKTRIVGDWEITKILIDGSDNTNIINVDSLKIFSKYSFKNLGSNHQGDLQVVTSDNIFQYSHLEYNFGYADHKNHLELFTTYGDWDTLFSKKLILPLGPINNFDGKISVWKILKLTNKQMHISRDFNSKKYELLFNKIHS